MKNKKGFTLIELIAVIIILAAIALVTFPALLNQISNTKGKINNATKEIIISAAKSYVNDNENDYSRNIRLSSCINLEQLVSSNYLSQSIVSSSDSLTDIGVKVSYNDGYIYEVKDMNECIIGTWVKYDPVSDEKCESGETCDTWYVLGLTDDEATLLMSRGLFQSSWNDATTDLNEETSDWAVTVSIPTRDQIIKAAGYKTYAEYTQHDNRSLPVWLVGLSYWTATPDPEDDEFAFIVFKRLKDGIMDYGEKTSTYSVRPIITTDRSILE